LDGLAIVVPDGESHYALPVVTCLGRHRGNRVHVLSNDSTARVRWSRYCASFTVVPAGDEDARFDAVEDVIGRVRADIVLPACETGVQILQARGDELRDRVALVPHEGSLEIGDKWFLAEILRDLGTPHPPTLLYTADAAFRRQLGAFPVLIKPRQMSGGYGIREFADRDSLLRFLERHPEMAHQCVVQAVVPGHDIGSSVLCRDGVVLAQSIQRPAGEVTQPFVAAAGLEMIDHPEAAKLVRRMFEALNWSGVANVDLRVDERDGSLSVLEVNPRYWSTLLASHAAGVDFPHLACLAALGVDFAPPRPRAQRFLQAKSSARAWWAVLRDSVRAPPAFSETIWPYLLADPMPHLMRVFRRGLGERSARVAGVPRADQRIEAEAQRARRAHSPR